MPCDDITAPEALQWGHGDEAVEERSVEPLVLRPDNFNGATAMNPWKS